MGSEFLRIAGNRSAYPDAAFTVLRLKEIAASWDREADDLTDEEAFDILRKKTWISLQRIGRQGDPVRDITPLADFVGLTGLCLWDNEISTINPIERLVQLERLGLRGNKIEDLSSIRDMVRVEELEVQENPIRDFAVLVHLPELKDLEISGDQLGAFAGMKELASLRSLRIHDSCESLKLLPILPNLRVLHLDGCRSLEGLERFTELRNLYIGSGELRELAPVSSLRKLTHLNFGHNQVVSLEPLKELFALRKVWAGRNHIRKLAPLEKLPVLHYVNLDENPVPSNELEALQASLTPWEDEFVDRAPQVQPAIDVEIVGQDVWDYYDNHPFNGVGYDDDPGLFESEKSWLLSEINEALEVDWTEGEDFTIPWQSPRARSHTVVLSSPEAAASLRAIAGAIQRVLCSARNEFIIYLQTDLDGGMPTIWVYRNRILVASKDEEAVMALLKQ
jgi:Leucine-rich repeat (LRR) protein